MPELTVLSALTAMLRDRVRALAGPGRAHHADPEAGGIISEYAVVLGIAVAAIGIIALLVAAIRGRFAQFIGG
jgi:Flp pilus assembly pilin Flp